VKRRKEGELRRSMPLTTERPSHQTRVQLQEETSLSLLLLIGEGCEFLFRGGRGLGKVNILLEARLLVVEDGLLADVLVRVRERRPVSVLGERLRLDVHYGRLLKGGGARRKTRDAERSLGKSQASRSLNQIKKISSAPISSNRQAGDPDCS
jgi:hypothetical protein